MRAILVLSTIFIASGALAAETRGGVVHGSLKNLRVTNVSVCQETKQIYVTLRPGCCPVAPPVVPVDPQGPKPAAPTRCGPDVIVALDPADPIDQVTYPAFLKGLDVGTTIGLEIGDHGQVSGVTASNNPPCDVVPVIP